MKIYFSIAKKGERYWWLQDNKNLIYRNYFSIYRCHEKDTDDILIFGFIFGPFHWRVVREKTQK